MQTLTFPDKLSIAVLPFDNISGDSDQEYFADGMAEDIITALSRWRALLQDVELIPQHQDFGFKPPSRFAAVAQHADEKVGNCEHPAIMF